jgi:Family of unknown function (DUF6006)
MKMKLITRFYLGLTAVILSVANANAVLASQYGGAKWFLGTWDCNIDGRHGVIHWKVVSTNDGGCNGNSCTSSSGVAIKGWISDNGQKWVPLGMRSSNQQEAFFHYLGGEQDTWHLSYDKSTRVARGNTTWNGHPYPLQCIKR